MTKYVLRHNLGAKNLWAGPAWHLASRRDGAQEEADGAAGGSFKVDAVLHALADEDRVGEAHHRAHDDLGRWTRLDRLKLAVRNAVELNDLDDRAHQLLVVAYRLPVLLDGDKHDVVDALLGHQVFPMIRQDLEDQALQADRRRGFGACHRPSLLLDLAEAALTDRLDDRDLRRKEPIDVGGRHLELGRDVGHRSLGIPQAPEQRIRGLRDAAAGIVWTKLDLRVHRYIRILNSDEFCNSSVGECQPTAARHAKK